MEIPLLQDISIIFGLSIIVLLVSHQLRLPTVVGFLLTGIFVGPHGLRLIKGLHEVEILAEIGVVILLFTIGLEFSFKELSHLKKAVLLGGSLQVALTVLATFALALKLGKAPGKAIFIGFLVALSSTAIVLKIFQEKAEVETPHGRAALAILIFQDIVVVLMMLFSPILAGAKGVRHNFDEFDGSENPYLNSQYKIFRKRLVELYHNMSRILSMEDKDERYRSLLAAFLHIEQEDNRSIKNTLSAVSEQKVQEMEISSLLLVNRLFTQACRMQIYGMKDLLLSLEQINDFGKAMDIKEMMDAEKAKTQGESE